MKVNIIILVPLVMATAVFAHGGVKDPQVMARMNLMTDIADVMKELGAISKGDAEFSADVVHDRADRLAEHARGIPALFEIEATDPKSEARAEIWTDWSGFEEATKEMENAALALGAVKTEAAFQSAFDVLGKTCGGCHKDFRIKKD